MDNKRERIRKFSLVVRINFDDQARVFNELRRRQGLPPLSGTPVEAEVTIPRFIVKALMRSGIPRERVK